MSEKATTRRWLEDPRLSLENLSPGQRYTAVIAGALALAMITVGVPRGDTTPAAATSYTVPSAAMSAGLVPAPTVAPPTTAYAPLAAFPSAPPDTTTTTMAPAPTYQPAPAPPPSESPSSTTTTTAPPASPLPIPGVTIP